MEGREEFSHLLYIERTPSHPCPYLPGLEARDQAFLAALLPGDRYEQLMEHGWRRSGRIVYRPVCDNCRACRPLRVPVNEFQPNRTQQRSQRRNADLEVRQCEPEPSEETFDLYVRYQEARHDGDMCTEWDEFCDFLYESPIPTTREFQFRLSGRLMATVIADETPNGFSAVYSWFDPEEQKRSLGTYMVLWLIEEAKRRDFQWVYLGHYVRDCRKMSYKAKFHPFELGGHNGGWYRPKLPF